MVADTVTNLMAVRTAAAEPQERDRVRRPDAPVGRRRPAGPVHLHADPAAAGDVHRGRHAAGPGGRHDHGRAPLGVDRRALPDPLLLGPGGARPPAVVRAPAVLRPLPRPGGQVHRHRRRRGRRSPTRRRRWPAAGGRRPGRVRATSTSATAAGSPLFDDLSLHGPPGRARGPGRTVGIGQVDAVQAAAAVHGRGRAARSWSTARTSGT